MIDPPDDWMPHTLGLLYGLEVEASVVRTHEEAVRAWREGRLPTVDPPAPFIIRIETT